MTSCSRCPRPGTASRTRSWRESSSSTWRCGGWSTARPPWASCSTSRRCRRDEPRPCGHRRPPIPALRGQASWSRLCLPEAVAALDRLGPRPQAIGALQDRPGHRAAGGLPARGRFRHRRHRLAARHRPADLHRLLFVHAPPHLHLRGAHHARAHLPRSPPRDAADYMTSNLNPTVYLAAKVAGAWSVLVLVTVFPVIIVLASYSLFGHGPGSIIDWFKTLAEIVGAGLELAVFYGTIALAISSLTDRNSFASAGIILTFVLSGAALGILQGPLKAPDWVALLNVNLLPSEVLHRIYQAQWNSGAANVQTWEVAAAAAGWVLAGLGVLAFRYRGEGRK